MTEKEKFAGFDFSHNPMKKKQGALGDEAVDASNARLAKMSEFEK